MSSRTRCNFCNMKSIAARAKQQGLAVRKRAATWGMGGIDVFVVPPHVSNEQIGAWTQPCEEMPDGDENWEKYHKAWFMDLPDHCVC